MNKTHTKLLAGILCAAMLFSDLAPADALSFAAEKDTLLEAQTQETASASTDSAPETEEAEEGALFSEQETETAANTDTQPQR